MNKSSVERMQTKRKPNHWWIVPGLTDRQENVFRWVTRLVVVVMVAAWTLSIIDAYTRPDQSFGEASAAPVEAKAGLVTKTISSSLLSSEAPTTAFVDEAALEIFDPLRGHSGKLRAAFRSPGEEVVAAPNSGVRVRYDKGNQPVASSDFLAPDDPGLYKLAVEVGRATRPLEDLSLITIVPFSEKKKGKIGLYYLGSWPYEGGGKPRSPSYANPEGFIEVTPQNKDFYVSEHFRLRDFLTKDQYDKWPKYLLLDPRLLDKLELAIAELEGEGVNVEHVTVMSGFRTPRYNHSGGNTAGRANLSRHMYGDAADVYVDNDRNGNPDDINGDGRVTTKDAELFGAAVERVEKKYPSLGGGIGVYTACCGHGPFTHVDVRGYRARWRGSGNG